MGNSINFPKNYDVYVLKAIRFLEKGNLQEAEEYIKKAYNLEEKRTAVMLYTSILTENGKTEEALEIAKKHLSIFESTEENQLFYLSLLKKQRQFIQAETLFKKWEKQKQLPISEEWARMEHQIASEKDEMVKEEIKAKKILTERFSKLGDFTPEQQMSFLQEVDKIPIDQFQKITRSLLLHPYVSNESKTVLIHLLIEQESILSYQILWFDELKEINPSLLDPLERQKVFKTVHSILEKKLEKNPSLLAMIQQEADCHFFRLYPFIEEVVTDSAEWAHYYLETYDSQFIPQEKENLSSNMREWFEHLTLEP